MGFITILVWLIGWFLAYRSWCYLAGHPLLKHDSIASMLLAVVICFLPVWPVICLAGLVVWALKSNDGGPPAAA